MNVTTTQLERMVKNYGVAAVIALGLTYWLVFSVNGALAAQAAKLDALRDTMTTHVSDTNTLLYQICLNTASTPAQLAGCQVRAH